MSQPRPDASWPRQQPGPNRSGSPGSPASPWSPKSPHVPAAGRPRGVGVPLSDPDPAGAWTAGATERGLAEEQDQTGQRDPAEEQDQVGQRGLAEEQDRGVWRDRAGGRDRAGERRAVALTGRGAVAGMLAVFFFSLLVASWLQWGVLAGAGFVIGSVAGTWYTKPRDLLTAVVSPPLLFFCALVCVKALTATGSTIISTVEGTALTLANVAPWLFAGVVVYLIVAWVRGLPQSVAGLRRDLRPDLTQARVGSPQAKAAGGGYQPGVRRYR